MLEYLNPKISEKKEPELKRNFEVGWKEMSTESLELLLSAARERVQDSIKDHAGISKKFFSLLVLVLSLSSGLIAFMFSSNPDKNLYVIAFVSLLICSLNIFIIAQMIRPRKFRAPGRVPSKAINYRVIRKKDSKEDNFKRLVYVELLNCEAQIEINQYYNMKRLDAMDFVIRLLLIAFIVLSILTLIIKLI